MDYKVIYKKYVGYEFNDFPVLKHASELDRQMYLINEYVFLYHMTEADNVYAIDDKLKERYVEYALILLSLPSDEGKIITVTAECKLQNIRYASCNACGKLNLFGHKKCSLCNNAWYCSIDCQKKDYNSHKTMCIKDIRNVICEHIKKNWTKVFNFIPKNSFKLFKTKFNGIDIYVVIGLYIDVFCIDISMKGVENLTFRRELYGNAYFTTKYTSFVKVSKDSHISNDKDINLYIILQEKDTNVYNIDYETGLLNVSVKLLLE